MNSLLTSLNPTGGRGVNAIKAERHGAAEGGDFAELMAAKASSSSSKPEAHRSAAPHRPAGGSAASSVAAKAEARAQAQSEARTEAKAGAKAPAEDQPATQEAGEGRPAEARAGNPADSDAEPARAPTHSPTQTQAQPEEPGGGPESAKAAVEAGELSQAATVLAERVSRLLRGVRGDEPVADPAVTDTALGALSSRPAVDALATATPGAADAASVAPDISGLMAQLGWAAAMSPERPVTTTGSAATGLMSAAAGDASNAVLASVLASVAAGPADASAKGAPSGTTSTAATADFGLLLAAPASPIASAPTAAPGAPVDVRQPQWPQAMSEQVQLLLAGDIKEAKIRLSPDDLGSVQVHIKVHEDAVQVQLAAQHSATRDLLQDALPRLRELLNQQGLQLSQAQVFSGHAQSDSQGRPGAQGAHFGHFEGEGDATAMTPVLARVRVGLLDDYA